MQPSFVAGHPSAACPSNPVSALGLQHDVEATPKGGAVLNSINTGAVNKEAQLLIDASDANGRCHDGGTFGLTGTAQGGLEIIDITNPALPKEIGLTSHIGEAHTVNIDPKRPHIAYAVTSDSVSVDANGMRANESPGGGEGLSLDGFEVVDLSSCMNFPAGTTLETKRAPVPARGLPLPLPERQHRARPHAARPHLRVPRDRDLPRRPAHLRERQRVDPVQHEERVRQQRHALQLHATTSRAATPLPCKTRPSSSEPPFQTGAVVDRLRERRAQRRAGSARRAGLARGRRALARPACSTSAASSTRAAAPARRPRPPAPSWQDIDFAHEAELTQSRKFLIVTDERGGGVLPPGASCPRGGDTARATAACTATASTG